MRGQSWYTSSSATNRAQVVLDCQRFGTSQSEAPPRLSSNDSDLDLSALRIRFRGGLIAYQRKDDMTSGTDPRERALLREIGALSDRVRELRRPDSGADGAQIKALEVESRSKWEELRQIRAGSVVVDESAPRRRGMYI